MCPMSITVYFVDLLLWVTLKTERSGNAQRRRQRHNGPVSRGGEEEEEEELYFRIKQGEPFEKRINNDTYFTSVAYCILIIFL